MVLFANGIPALTLDEMLVDGVFRFDGVVSRDDDLDLASLVRNALLLALDDPVIGASKRTRLSDSASLLVVKGTFENGIFSTSFSESVFSSMCDGFSLSLRGSLI